MLNSAEDLVKLATDVLGSYEILPDNIQVIQEGGIKTVWRIDYKNKLYCLKRLRHTLDKALFSVYAQIYIKSRGGKVPEVILNKRGSGITEYNNHLFVLYEWILGRNLNFNDTEDICLSVQGLAEFHKASVGYKPAESSINSSRIGKWLNEYESMKNNLIEWKEVASTNIVSQPYTAYLKVIDPIIDIANYAIDLLKHSPYDELTLSDRGYFVLNHQDYGKGNALLGEEGVYIIDLDGVTYDFPARDLRKIISKQAEDRLNWDKTLIDWILDCYEKGCSLTPELKRILYIDLIFPHCFFGQVKNIFIKNKDEKISKIQRIADLEMSKIPVLQSLL